MSLDPMPDAATLLRMKAERERRMFGIPVQVSDVAPPGTVTFAQDGKVVGQIVNLATPVTIRIPWSALVSDNDKFVAKRRGEKAMMVITAPYAAAKARIAQLATDTMQGRTAMACPLSLTARVWFPSGRTNDLTNWCKLVHDALNGIVYQDDRWLHDVRWIRAGVDVDAPRCELTITPLTP